MENNIIISNLNDFIFCPRSIYFHNLYYSYNENLFHTSYQSKGKQAHKNIDNKTYSSKKNILQGIETYSEELGVTGKIDILDLDNKELIERKNKIKVIYEGYYLQLYAQYFCLLEMGYEIKKIGFYSMSDNKKINIELPKEKEKQRLKEVIKSMQDFDIEDSDFKQNPEKCKMCIYRNLCDIWKNDE